MDHWPISTHPIANLRWASRLKRYPLDNIALVHFDVDSLLGQVETQLAIKGRVKYLVKVVIKGTAVSFGAALIYVVICDLDTDNPCQLKGAIPSPGRNRYPFHP